MSEPVQTLRTYRLRAMVGENRRLELQLPEDMPTGEVEINVHLTDGDVSVIETFGDLRASGVLGAWSDREDIGDPIEFARKLREEAWRGK